jgi:hypothetical protein
MKVGNLSKMVAKPTSPVTYELTLGEALIPLNPYVGKELALHFTQRIHCVGCKRLIRKSFQEGYCFPCTQKLARCDFCIIKPERCHYHLGTCREVQWAHQHCMISHVVYLSQTSGLKVGITRSSQIPTRWLDQGAVAALPLFEVPNRRLSGLLEVKIAKSLSDKTNWRKMLMGFDGSVDLLYERKQVLAKIENELRTIGFPVECIQNPTISRFEYPVIEYPKKITSLCFNKTKSISGTLMGIKGQYLIFDSGVINIRKYSGYELEMDC